MKKEQFIDVFFRRIQRIKRFLTSKDLFIFLFFLAMSTALWGLHAMRKTYETVIQIPILYENLPLGYVQTEELPEKLNITVSDRGSMLLSYRIARRFSPVSIDMRELSREETLLGTEILKPAILKQFNASTQIIRISPDFLHFRFKQLKMKVLPVKLDNRIELAQQYILSDSIEIIPKKIEVYAPENILDTMQFAYTEPLILINLRDTIQQSVKLKEIKDVVYSSSHVDITIKTELYTEKTVDVPIIVTNVPSHHILRVFPSVVKVSFQLGLSWYDKINASSFILAVDYQKTLEENDIRKLPIEIKKQPENVFNVRINPGEVDYLIEEKE